MRVTPNAPHPKDRAKCGTRCRRHRFLHQRHSTTTLAPSSAYPSSNPWARSIAASASATRKPRPARMPIHRFGMATSSKSERPHATTQAAAPATRAGARCHVVVVRHMASPNHVAAAITLVNSAGIKRDVGANALSLARRRSTSINLAVRTVDPLRTAFRPPSRRW